MRQFIESIRIEDGRICNLAYHEQRLNETRKYFWPESVPLQLAEFLHPSGKAGVHKARIVYGEKGVEEIGYAPYLPREVHTLAIVRADDIEYSHKSADRNALNALFAKRGSCDDVLIVKNDFLTDTSIANIALYDDTTWWPPSKPLLRGTKRAKLLDDRVIKERNLTLSDLHLYSKIRLVNAMINWGEIELPINALQTEL